MMALYVARAAEEKETRDTPRGLRADEREGAGVLFEGMGASWMRERVVGLGPGWRGAGALQIEGGACLGSFSGVL